MEEQLKNNKTFGLLGRNISYSFSKTYFSKKFKKLHLDNYRYLNFDITSIEKLPHILQDNTIIGLNVTIPYKEQVIPFLDRLDPSAEAIGAVNTIKRIHTEWVGFNTDVFGFEVSLQPLLKKQHTKALILGTGGASKAIQFVLKKLDISVLKVSRNPSKHQISYDAITKELIEEHSLIINCTPMGTHPHIDTAPQLPYHYLSKKHLLYDLIYNPPKTQFLSHGEKQGATICNGLKMLELQAEKSWDIWNDKK